MCILKTEHLSIKFGNKEILNEINLSIQTGKRTAIIGPNGSGKSTLLKALSGLLKPAQGTVFFAEKDIRSYGKKQLAQRLAILPQGASSPNDLTVGELIDYGRFPHRNWWGGNDAADQEIVDWALSQTGLAHLNKRLLSTLSGGERQRAWIAMALAQKPSVLLLDEPTTYLDIAHQLEVMQTVSALNKKNAISIIMVLHDLNHAMRYADEIIVVKDGRIFAKGTPDQTVDLNLLKQVFKVNAEVFKNDTGQNLFIPNSVLK